VAKLDLDYNYYFSQTFNQVFPGARVKALTNSVISKKKPYFSKISKIGLSSN